MGRREGNGAGRNRDPSLLGGALSPAHSRTGGLTLDLAVWVRAKAQWAELLARAGCRVTDGGFTEVAPGSGHVVADHPALRSGTGSLR